MGDRKYCEDCKYFIIENGNPNKTRCSNVEVFGYMVTEPVMRPKFYRNCFELRKADGMCGLNDRYFEQR